MGWKPLWAPPLLGLLCAAKKSSWSSGFNVKFFLQGQVTVVIQKEIKYLLQERVDWAFLWPGATLPWQRAVLHCTNLDHLCP